MTRQVIITNPVHLPTDDGRPIGHKMSVGTGTGLDDNTDLVTLSPGQSFIGYPLPGAAIIVTLVEAEPAPIGAAAIG